MNGMWVAGQQISTSLVKDEKFQSFNSNQEEHYDDDTENTLKAFRKISDY